jgi:hypothetical protein
VEDLGRELRVATGCGRCRDCACKVIAEEKLALWREDLRDGDMHPDLLPAGAPA